MAGLLAWAADVVKAHGGQSDEEADKIPLIFTEEQQKYAQELHQKATSLSRSIQDLRLRLPSPDISQRLPHLHAHSLAYNNALALQLNSHSSTREQAHLRAETLQEENAAYEKAITDCENKIHEKTQEAYLLRRKLEEIDETEKKLKDELENPQTASDDSLLGKADESVNVSEMTVEAISEDEASKSAILEELESKKRELSTMEEIVQDLEIKWAEVQDNALKQPSPVQRESILDKQLHSLIEQLETKQVQAEGLVSEIHLKETELERLSGLWRRLESSNIEMNAARNRFGRSNSETGYSSSDYIIDPHHKSHTGRGYHQNRLTLLRSAFVLYILALHILVFIKISF
ncbi:leucine-rich repeat-containing protein [Tripterygium wilfordii]|uniref:Leucine-rich repeat-containing protein n=1 Tax=Tripterygium wilfordii TaxID=458696 RepID=A0A7J7DUI3_TRIWF|nr:uncharacterized protein LOC119987373 [Tripterygium wilfordii]KAF5749949.1 leucine-rich repeat-containing protein [Tripterygium wilfordii]